MFRDNWQALDSEHAMMECNRTISEGQSDFYLILHKPYGNNGFGCFYYLMAQKTQKSYSMKGKKISAPFSESNWEFIVVCNHFVHLNFLLGLFCPQTQKNPIQNKMQLVFFLHYFKRTVLLTSYLVNLDFIFSWSFAPAKVEPLEDCRKKGLSPPGKQFFVFV